MKPDGLPRLLLTAFVIALTVYAVFYAGIEHLRTRKGPWQVAFTNTVSGTPAVLIGQPRLGITNVEITFPGDSKSPTNAGALLLFAQPRQVPYPVPYGECIFMDTTFLPGTVVFNLFGHEIQLLPRVLTIDKKEVPWRSNETIPLPRRR